MTDAIESLGLPQADEKAAISAQESYGSERQHSHHEVIDREANGAILHESEKDIPVR